MTPHVEQTLSLSRFCSVAGRVLWSRRSRPWNGGGREHSRLAYPWLSPLASGMQLAVLVWPQFSAYFKVEEGTVIWA
jgi:hypothetical protein